MKIAILLTSGFEEAEAWFITDIFRRANIKTDLVSISAKKGE
jgi:putative intracellular protease/amidase